jgi:hypothetical protein
LDEALEGKIEQYHQEYWGNKWWKPCIS